MQNKFIGKWRITNMDQWDQDYVNEVEPGYIEFKKSGLGSLHFGFIFADIDYRAIKTSDGYYIEFSFSGNDEYDEICGRGKLNQKGKEMDGCLYIHCGDESNFSARPFG